MNNKQFYENMVVIPVFDSEGCDLSSGSMSVGRNLKPFVFYYFWTANAKKLYMRKMESF